MTNQFWILPQHDEYLSIVYTHTLPPAPAISDMSDNFLPLMANFWTPTLPTLKLDIIYLSAQFLRSIG